MTPVKFYDCTIEFAEHGVELHHNDSIVDDATGIQIENDDHEWITLPCEEILVGICEMLEVVIAILELESLTKTEQYLKIGAELFKRWYENEGFLLDIERQIEKDSITELFDMFRNKRKQIEERGKDPSVQSPDWQIMNACAVALSRSLQEMALNSKFARIIKEHLDLFKNSEGKVDYDMMSEWVSVIVVRYGYQLANQTKSKKSIQVIHQIIGEAVQIELQYRRIQQVAMRYAEKIAETNDKLPRYLQTKNTLKALKWFVEKNPDLPIYIDWTERDQIEVGKVLVDQLGTVFISLREGDDSLTRVFRIEDIPRERYVKNKKPLKTISITPEVQQFINDQQSLDLFDEPWRKMMVIKPTPWTEIYSGGYRYNRLPLVEVERSPKWTQLVHQLWDTIPMSAYLKGLNRIQETAFQINPVVLKFQQDNIGQPIAGMPDPKKEPVEFAQFKRRLQEAEYFSRFERIYTPYKADFRGRIYPYSTLVNIQGEDGTRALLNFAEQKPIGKGNGIYWLQVHIANCLGVKGPLDERVDIVQEMEAELLEVADDPIKNDWWMDTSDVEDPMQLLAAVMEYKNWVDFGNGYLSGLPITIDATQSGLALMAIITRDSDAWDRIVNHDTYLLGAEMVSTQMMDDTNMIPHLVEFLQGPSGRDFMKKPTVSFGYASTPYRWEQDARMKLRKLGWSDYFEAGRAFRDALVQVFPKLLPGPHRLRDWFQMVARECAIRNQPIYWRSPLLTLVQANHMQDKTGAHRYRYSFGSPEIYTASLPKEMDKLSTADMKSGIGANFIHSMDAAIQMMIVNEAYKHGLRSFGVIHDCISVHSQDIDLIRDIIWKVFKEFSKIDWLEIFRLDVQTQLGIELPPFDRYGDLVLPKEMPDTFYS